MKFYKIGTYYIPENSINYITELREGKARVYVINFGNENNIKVSASVAAEIGIKEADNAKAYEEASEGQKRGKKVKR